MTDISYYFNSKSTSVWTDPEKMIDNILTNYATTSTDGNTEVLNGNTCPGTNLGTISKVEIRTYGYGDGDDRIDLTPVFAGGDGDEHQTTPADGTPGWGTYQDITSDTNRPLPWTWSAVQILDCKVEYDKVGAAHTMYCAKIEIRVTYTGTVGWLPGYTYGKKKPVNSTTAGAQTNFQMELLVGESSGASGEDIDCEGHCHDFPNDIRFTAANGTTKHDYWVKNITGTTPNQLATMKIEVASIPASGDVDLYMYYGKTPDAGESNGDNTFEFFDDFEYGPNLWTKYSGNPLDIGTPYGLCAAWIKESSTYYMFYRKTATEIWRATSSNGKTGWTNSPSSAVLSTGSSGNYDDNAVMLPVVWKEGSYYYMIYTAHKASDSKWRGFIARSTDMTTWNKWDGTGWTGAASPILEPSVGWEGNMVELSGIIKVGTTYYMWYNNILTVGVRESGLATSTNLTSWTKDASNPLFTSGRYGGFEFKKGSYYYLLIPHYTSGSDYAEIELYRDTNPTFYSANRTLCGIAFKYGASGQWDEKDLDCPYVLMDDIQRTVFTDNELWTYYGAINAANTIKLGLTIESDIDTAISCPSDDPDSDKWEIDAQPTHFTVHDGILDVNSSGEQNVIRTKTYSASDYIIEMKWKFTYWHDGSRDGLLARYENISNFYNVWLADLSTTGSEKAMICGKRVSGAFTESSNYSNFNWNLDTWYDVKFVIEGNNLKGYFEDGLKSSQTWTDFASGKIGLRTYYADLEIDDFRVRKHASPEPTWGTSGDEMTAARSQGYIF